VEDDWWKMEDNPQKHLKTTQKQLFNLNGNLNDNENDNCFPCWFKGGDSEVTAISSNKTLEK